MILETIGGLLSGGLFRLLPEVLSLFKGRSERDHEYRMAELSGRQAKEMADARLAIGEQRLQSADIEAIIEATKAQAQTSGIGWADALSATVRPVVTYWWLALYTAYQISIIIASFQAGGSVTATLIDAWGPEDQAVMASIFSFWFVDRSLRKKPV